MSPPDLRGVLKDTGLYPRVAGYDLMPLQPTDLLDLAAHFSDPLTLKYLDFEAFEGPDQALQVIEWADDMVAEGSGVRFAIRDPGGAFMGTIGFHRIAMDNARRGEIGYDLRPLWWGRGVMAALMPAILAYGHQTLGLHRIEAMVTDGNQRSCRLLERHGFRFEGLMRGYGFWGGDFHDERLYGRLAADPVRDLAV